jgi:hypothetical protein
VPAANARYSVQDAAPVTLGVPNSDTDLDWQTRRMPGFQVQWSMAQTMGTTSGFYLVLPLWALEVMAMPLPGVVAFLHLRKRREQARGFPVVLPPNTRTSGDSPS